MGMTGTPTSPMIVRDAHAGGLIRVNSTFRQVLRYAADELVQQPVLDWIHPADRGALEQALEAGSGCLRARHQTAEGSWVTLDWQVRQEESGPVVFGTVHRDSIANSQGGPLPPVRMPETIGELLTAMALIIEDERPGMKCSVLLLDEAGRQVSVGAGPSLPAEYNAAIEGLHIGPGVGSCGTAAYWNQRVIVEDIESDVLWRDLKPYAAIAGVRSCWSHPITSMSGKVLGATALYSPSPRAPRRAELDGLERSARMFGLAIDRWRAEEALRESEARRSKRELELEDQLHQAAKMEALGVLAGGLAHDFNNLLGSVLGNAELAMSTVQEGGETHQMLQDIVTASNRAAELCSQMLTYAGRGIISTQRLDCNTLIREFGSLLQVTMSKKARLDYGLSSEALFVEADRGQLGQVIMNLITNAAESLEGGSGTITVQTDLCPFTSEELAKLQPSMPLESGVYVRLRVADTGCGMSDEVKGRIFDPFFTTKFTGRGLGLAAVQGIVLRHHGAIDLQSEPGRGTTFTVLLPYAEAPVEQQASERVHRAPGLKRVLIVDDELMLRRTLGRILQRAGFEVLQAANGREAIEVYRAECRTIDCVLLDFSMPDLDGEETFQELRRIRPDVQAVLNSGCAEREMMLRFKDVGFAGMLQKPTPRDVLVAMIQQITG